MPWIIALLSLIAGYFLVLGVMIWLKCKAKIDGSKLILVLVFKNAGATAEAVMWDLFRLQSWHYQELDFMVIDDKSEDDTLQILRILRRSYPFVLISTAFSRKFEQLIQTQGEKVRVLHITGPECPKLVRKKIICLLNRYDHEGEPALRKYS